MAISEKIELLGKGVYKSIPDVLTLKSIPTLSELDYVGNEDFDATMLDTILPQAVEEKINFRELLEIDYDWICRCLRILNYGPYHTTNVIFCDKCGEPQKGEFRVNLQTVGCKPLPEGFKNDQVIPTDAFIDFKGDVHMKLLTIQQAMDYAKDKAFTRKDGTVNSTLARICYMITSMGTQSGMTPIEVKLKIQKEFSPSDYVALKEESRKIGDYGLRAAGTAQCPKCGSMNGAFLAIAQDRFFRPTVGDVRQWAADRSAGEAKDTVRSKKTNV